MNSTASSIRRENSQGIGLRESAETRLGFPDQQSTSISFLLTCPSLLSSISPSFLLFLSVSLHLQTRVDSWTVPQSWRSTATLWGVRGGGGVGRAVGAAVVAGQLSPSHLGALPSGLSKSRVYRAHARRHRKGCRWCLWFLWNWRQKSSERGDECRRRQGEQCQCVTVL